MSTRKNRRENDAEGSAHPLPPWPDLHRKPIHRYNLTQTFRFKGREIKTIMRLIQAHQAVLCEAWENIHDDID
jgi:hypothetical protein